MQEFKGKKFSVQTYTAASGRIIESVIHPGAAVILPYLDRDRILLIKNRRCCIDKVLLELPAGTLEKYESPDQTALRELIEETGYSAKSISFLFSFYSTPGFCTEKIYVFSAQGLTQGKQKLDPSEEIEVYPVLFKEALELIKTNQIEDGKTIAALLFANQFEDYI